MTLFLLRPESPMMIVRAFAAIGLPTSRYRFSYLRLSAGGNYAKKCILKEGKFHVWTQAVRSMAGGRP